MNENWTETTQEEVATEVQAALAEPVAAPENNNALFTDTPNFTTNAPKKTPMYVPAFVLGILSIVFGLLIALVGEILGIIGISLAASRRGEYNVTAGMICSIVGLVVAVINHVLGFILLYSA